MSTAAYSIYSTTPTPFSELGIDECCEQLLPLVREIARKLHRRLPKHIALEDMVSAGTIGLLHALHRLDRPSEAEFFAYVRLRVKGAILDAFRAEDWAPRSLRRRARAIQNATSDLQQRGLEITDDTLAAEIGSTASAVRKTVADVHTSAIGSLHEAYGDSDELLIDHIADTEALNALGRLLANEDSDRVIGRMDELPERERLILKLSFYEDLSNRMIGQILDLSESRVSQLKSRALATLRTKLS